MTKSKSKGRASAKARSGTKRPSKGKRAKPAVHHKTRTGQPEAVLALLSRPSGATIAAITQATRRTLCAAFWLRWLEETRRGSVRGDRPYQAADRRASGFFISRGDIERSKAPENSNAIALNSLAFRTC